MMGAPASRPQAASQKTKTPRSGERGVGLKISEPAGLRLVALGGAYFAKTIFATFALAREAAFLCTTPDFTALSMAEV